jgi:hypothetical protein
LLHFEKLDINNIAYFCEHELFENNNANIPKIMNEEKMGKV